MRYRLIIVPLIIVFLLVSCKPAGNSEDGDTPVKQTPEITEGDSSISTETYVPTLAVTPTPEPVKPEINVDITDEWLSDYWDSQAQYYNELGLLDLDLQLAGIKLGTSEEDFNRLVTESPISITEEEIDEYLLQKTYAFNNSLLVTLSKYDPAEYFSVSRIETESSMHATYRGIKVGDSAELLIEKYGYPWYMSDGEWSYGPPEGSLTFHIFMVEDGIITKICVSHPC